MSQPQEPPLSQFASSLQEPQTPDPDAARSPRQRKRSRNAHASASSSSIEILNLDADDSVPLSQVSPLKPKSSEPRRLPRPSLFSVSVDDDDEEVIVLSPSPTRRTLPQARVLPRVRRDWKKEAKDAGVLEHGLHQGPSDSASCQRAIRAATPAKRAAGNAAAAPATQGLDHEAIHLDIEIPSPPSLSSSDEQCEVEKKREDNGTLLESLFHEQPQLSPKAKNTLPASSTRPRDRKPDIIDASNPPEYSQDSVYFSFEAHPDASRDSVIARPVNTQEPVRDALQMEKPSEGQKRGKRYYTRAFDYVVTEVLARYRYILRRQDIDVATLLQKVISPNGQALFVRIYRRKQPHWYRASSLQDSYSSEMDVTEAVEELCDHGFLFSSSSALNGSPEPTTYLAEELLPTLDLSEIRNACGSVVEGRSVRKLPKNRILPVLRKMLKSSSKGNVGKRRFAQTTLSGITPSECLARAVLRVAGDSVKIPNHILASLERMHFLFFLEDGHDSPNVILADTGKTKFPSYECKPSKTIFQSSFAFEDYEAAIKFEQRLNSLMDQKEWSRAAYLGSIAELEVREFFRDALNMNQSEGMSSSADMAISQQRSGTALQIRSSCRSAQQRALDRKDAINQLRHPFFRRYTAQWVYVRACWHSVHALERMGEYESAVSRLKLLLLTDLMPKRRGKCLNRLTINLFKHLGKLEEALQIIVSALESNSHHLNYGDRNGLAQRGVAIHKKLLLPGIEASIRKGLRSKVSRKRAALIEEQSKRPDVLVQTLASSSVKVSVRRIYGKSLNVLGREERETMAQGEDPWEKFLGDQSRDSFASASSSGLPVMGKSIFSSFRSKGGNVSVEDYCREWYHGKQGWKGVHDEGGSVRFLFTLFLWDSVLFAPVPDVFQTPYQDRPLDLFTEAFYTSRKVRIESRLAVVASMRAGEIHSETLKLYGQFEGTRAVGCAWSSYSASDLADVAAGLGPRALAHTFRLLSQDFMYWGGGLPDLTLWKRDKVDDVEHYKARLVEVKSARDVLSERQRAWLMELQSVGADCEVCKVVEKVTSRNLLEIQEAKLDSVEINAIDALADGEDEKA